MNDIKNLTDKIIADANAYAAAMAEDAAKQADEIISSYRQKAQAILDSEAEKAEKAANEAISRNLSSQKLNERNAVLSVKAQILDDVFKKASGHLLALGKDEYTQLLLGFFKDSACKGNLALCLNEKDLKAVGNDFYAVAKEYFEKEFPGCTLTLSEVPVKIDGGFILKNGDIEYNCSVSGYLSALREKHQNEIYKILFN
ncbi:MAG: hypothetical protein IJO52_09445 [Clostridia bacterium]|nr:hypothetical protein [Clostridia bacterium]